MSSAFQEPLVVSEEFIRPPIEGRSRVGAMVNIGIELSPEIHNKALDQSFSPKNVELLRSAWRNSIKFG
ncbi:MAG: hypothetical protein QOJ36_547 [Verrucomicrobiota bacterium]|jgi:hypothetical protein